VIKRAVMVFSMIVFVPHIKLCAEPAPAPKPDPIKAVTEQIASNDPAQVDAAITNLREKSSQPLPNTAFAAFAASQWIPAMISAKRYADAEQIALLCILNIPDCPVEPLQQLRIKALLAQNKNAEALVAAKGLFNVASMTGTADALQKIAQCLELVHPDDRMLLKRFKLQQMAGAATQPTSQPIESDGPDVMASIKIDPTPYAARIKELTDKDYITLISKGKLLLLAGRARAVCN